MDHSKHQAASSSNESLLPGTVLPQEPFCRQLLCIFDLDGPKLVAALLGLPPTPKQLEFMQSVSDLSKNATSGLKVSCTSVSFSEDFPSKQKRCNSTLGLNRDLPWKKSPNIADFLPRRSTGPIGLAHKSLEIVYGAWAAYIRAFERVSCQVDPLVVFEKANVCDQSLYTLR